MQNSKKSTSLKPQGDVKLENQRDVLRQNFTWEVQWSECEGKAKLHGAEAILVCACFTKYTIKARDPLTFIPKNESLRAQHTLMQSTYRPLYLTPICDPSWSHLKVAIATYGTNFYLPKGDSGIQLFADTSQESEFWGWNGNHKQ